MGKAFIQESTLTDIANAIRAKNGTSNTYLPSQMAAAISNIPTGISNEWLWFMMPNGGVLTLDRTGSPNTVTLQFSIDNGTTWTEWVENGTSRTYTLLGRQIIHIRNASETSTQFSISDGTTVNDYYHFSLSAPTVCGGQLGSLLCKDYHNAVLQGRGNFRELFANNSNLMTTPLVSFASITRRTFQATYTNCTNIESCDLSSIQSVGVYGCMRMFSGCSNLKLIKCGFTSIGTNGIRLWVEDVAATGDLYCPSSLTLSEDDSGIPSGWTRHDIDN